MLIEVCEHLYSGLAPDKLARCPIIPSMNTHRTAISIDVPTNSVTVNTMLRAAITGAIGRDFSVRSGPVEKSATGGRPPGAQLYSFKAFRRAMQQKGAERHVGELVMRACCDWGSVGDRVDGRMLDRYYEQEEDVRQRLLREFHGVPNPPPLLVMPYKGDAPKNLAFLSLHPADSHAAWREWAQVKILSAIPHYNRGIECTPTVMTMRAQQFVAVFREPLNPTPGTFSLQPWGIVPALVQHPSPQIPPPREAMQRASMLLQRISLEIDASRVTKEATGAACTAMAVSLCCIRKSSEIPAITSLARHFALRFGLSAVKLQDAAIAAVSASQHHVPDDWPQVIAGVACAFSGSSAASDADAIARLLGDMRLGAADESQPTIATSVRLHAGAISIHAGVTVASPQSISATPLPSSLSGSAVTGFADLGSSVGE